MLRGTSPSIIAENIRIQKARGLDATTAISRAHSAAKLHAERGRLTQKAHDALPDDAFALSGRRFPIHTPDHAALALVLSKQFAPGEHTLVRQKVLKRHPGVALKNEKD